MQPCGQNLAENGRGCDGKKLKQPPRWTTVLLQDYLLLLGQVVDKLRCLSRSFRPSTVLCTQFGQSLGPVTKRICFLALKLSKKGDQFMAMFLFENKWSLTWLLNHLQVIILSVVYFDQRLGAAHSKRWSKQSFFVLKSLKSCFFSFLSLKTPKMNIYTSFELSSYLFAFICMACTKQSFKPAIISQNLSTHPSIHCKHQIAHSCNHQYS